MNTKWSVYPAVVVASLFGLIGLVLVWLQFTISIEPIEPNTSSLPKPQSEAGGFSTDSAATQRSADQQRSDCCSEQAQLVEQKAPPSISTSGRSSQGSLRMSNKTDQPVRVALLTQRSTAKPNGQTAFATPIHWDFAPGEGNLQGLVLSLPNGNLKLKKGDILVAFAQDGSRRYWGPYVVGETPMPTWNQRTSEWQMVLQP